MSADHQKAFDFAQECAKQLITLSTAILALTITFRADVVGAATGGRGLIILAWALFLFSIIAGLITLACLAGHLEKPPKGTPSIYQAGIRIPAGSQMVLFALGMILTLIYGIGFGIKSL